VAFERVTADDLLALAAGRRAAVPMHLGALLTFAPHEAKAAAVAAMVAERLDAVPRMRQRLHRPGPGGGRPLWVEDPGFDPARHVDVVTLGASAPAAGTDAVDPALLDVLADRVLAPLPQDRPMWRACVVADVDGWVRAIVLVVHHVLADGLGGLTLLAAMSDPAAAPGHAAYGVAGGHAIPGAARGRARPGDAPGGPAGQVTPSTGAPSWGRLVVDAWRGRVPRVRSIVGWWTRTHDGLRELGGGKLGRVAPTSLCVPTGPRRRVEVVEADLAAFHDAAAAWGATDNELVLVVLTGALRTLLASRGEVLSSLVVSVPVAGRTVSSAAELGNAVGVLPVRVALGADPRDRLASIVAARARLRSGRRGSPSAVAAPVVRVMAAAGAFQWFIRHQRLVHTFETNVRGPASLGSVAGAAVQRIVPVAVNPGNVTVSFDVLSAGGRLVTSIVSDPDHVPDHQVLREAVEAELAGVLTLTESLPPRSR
jgi:WS/DGAT/MGAT family acyltransferase